MAMVSALRRMAVAAVALSALVMVGAPSAAAAMTCPHKMGSQQQLTEASGTAAQWTMSDLRPSSDMAPGYPLAGRLWEATATVRAVSGAVTPVIPNFGAMGAGHVQYPVLWQLASPSGISAATLSEGQTATGRIYFDVTAADPMVVTYSNGGPKPTMMWCDMAAMAPMMSKPMQMDDCPCCDAGCPGCPERR